MLPVQKCPEMIQHYMKCFTFIGFLSGLNDNVQEGLTDNINEAFQMHMIVAFVVNKAWFIVILKNFRIGSINNVASVAGKDTEVFKFIGSSGKCR